MKTNIFLPKKINVGFQNREDTYTGKLAYVVYFDEKGKLRKEASWNSWRDEKIDSIIYENTPTEGFVLNKKAGGYSSGWNHRQTYVRVYDPRGFEFEITVPNLLFILENTSSVKGKGLEGKFVYGWDGKDLVLVPTSSPDYVELSKINEIIHAKQHITGKQLKIGATYLTKENEELIYMGKYDEYETPWSWYASPQLVEKKKGKSFYFYNRENQHFNIVRSLNSKIISIVEEECVDDYAELFDKMECLREYSPIDHRRDEYIPLTFDEIKNKYAPLEERSQWYSKTGYFFDGENYVKRDLHFKNHKIHKNIEESYYYYEIKNLNYHYKSNEPYYFEIKFKDLNEVMEKLKPARLRKYLENGKIYSEGL